jgi:beta-galactosidase
MERESIVSSNNYKGPSMKFGVCYYPEHWPAARWAEDARLMRELGLEIVRIGEFAWAKMEPDARAV